MRCGPDRSILINNFSIKWGYRVMGLGEFPNAFDTINQDILFDKL